MRVMVVLAAMLIAAPAAAQDAGRAPEAAPEAEAPAQVLLSRGALDAISDRCKARRRWLVRDGNAIALRFDRSAAAGPGNCVLEALRRSNAGPVGFTGNDSER
ncbi:hypothetical protein TPR58_22210 [Sphingomonas sp. HF-S3]|uniref:UrcA family protein n=1 Tax=Sphingomonas rustica TaxID=3103142 RepID=A0ABV0BEC9_9SPHN